MRRPPIRRAGAPGRLRAALPTPLDALDAKEFAAEGGYRRRTVEVETDDGARHTAVTYEVVSKEPRELAPRLEYVELLVRGARERALPQEWVALLEGLPARLGTV